jgi:hypothetical protein
MPDIFSSSQSFWPVYMIVADGSVSSYLKSQKNKKKYIAAISFFMLKEGEIHKEKIVQGSTCEL